MCNSVEIMVCADRVKEETRQSHEAAEQVMMPLIENATTPEQYGILLQKLFGFYRPLEQVLQPFAQQMNLPFSFQKSHLLLSDLQSLGLKPGGAHCTKLPQINDRFSALGALYVLEGAALGGRVICRMLQAKSTLLPEAFCFFEGRGKETGPHWKAFTQFLNSQADCPEHMDQVCTAAKQTFDLHAAWMK
jgi:heme oxygenase (biliverdin-IX-beta and delta-forming)